MIPHLPNWTPSELFQLAEDLAKKLATVSGSEFVKRLIGAILERTVFAGAKNKKHNFTELQLRTEALENVDSDLGLSAESHGPYLSCSAAVGIVTMLHLKRININKFPSRAKDAAEHYIQMMHDIHMLDHQSTNNNASINEAVGILVQASSPADYERADELLLAVQESQTSSLSRALVGVARSDLNLARTEYLQAADGFKAAATEVMRENKAKYYEYLFKAATALRYYGDEMGDNVILREAIKLYAEILRECERYFDSMQLAELKSYYWNTLQTLGERECGIDHLEEALEANYEALENCDLKKAPLEWAAIQNNLGNGLLAVGERESGVKRILLALDAYRAAVKIYTRKREVVRRAGVYSNIGTAEQVLGERENSLEQLNSSVSNIRKSIKSYNSANDSLNWAMAQNSMGNSLASLCEMEYSLPIIEMALTAYSNALTVYSKMKMGLHWAGVRSNYGSALQILGYQEKDIRRLKAAKTAYGEALEKNGRQDAPLDWAMMKNNMGNVLQLISDQDRGNRLLLEMSIINYSESLEVFTRKHGPMQFAAVRNNLGIAYYRLGELMSVPAYLFEARSAVELANEIYSMTGAKKHQNTIAMVLSEIASRIAGDSVMESLVVPLTAIGLLHNTSRFWVLKGITDD